MAFDKKACDRAYYYKHRAKILKSRREDLSIPEVRDAINAKRRLRLKARREASSGYG